LKWRQALLEDIALGSQTHGERLAAIEQEENDLIVALDELETQYGGELKLTEQLLESRQDISRQSEIQALQQQLNAMHSNPLLSADVDVRTVANVIADWTGVPLSSLMKDEQTGLLTLENEIGKRVVGQDVALTAIAQRLRAAKPASRLKTAHRVCSCWSVRAVSVKPKPRWRWPTCCTAAKNP
jgi:type VI secretion system protein VasG